MKKIVCLVLVFIMLFCGCSRWNVEIVDPTKPAGGEEELISSEQEESKDNTSNNDGNTRKLLIPAKTNFELKNGGFEPEFEVTIEDDVVLENEGDNLTAVFPDKNMLSLGWGFIYEIREYDKYDNPLYYYENPEESMGYISHEAVVCGAYECMRIKCYAYGGKEDSDSYSYRFDYFITVNESEILSLTFFAPNDLESTLKTQEAFVAMIKR